MRRGDDDDDEGERRTTRSRVSIIFCSKLKNFLHKRDKQNGMNEE